MSVAPFHHTHTVRLRLSAYPFRVSLIKINTQGSRDEETGFGKRQSRLGKDIDIDGSFDKNESSGKKARTDTSTRPAAHLLSLNCCSNTCEKIL